MRWFIPLLFVCVEAYAGEPEDTTNTVGDWADALVTSENSSPNNDADYTSLNDQASSIEDEQNLLRAFFEAFEEVYDGETEALNSHQSHELDTEDGRETGFASRPDTEDGRETGFASRPDTEDGRETGFASRPDTEDGRETGFVPRSRNLRETKLCRGKCPNKGHEAKFNQRPDTEDGRETGFRRANRRANPRNRLLHPTSLHLHSAEEIEGSVALTLNWYPVQGANKYLLRAVQHLNGEPICAFQWSLNDTEFEGSFDPNFQYSFTVEAWSDNRRYSRHSPPSFVLTVDP